MFVSNISLDRGNPEKEGAHLRMHGQTSTGPEVEGLRKTLEVCTVGDRAGRACWFTVVQFTV